MFSPKSNHASSRGQQTAQQVETSCFPCPIRSDEPDNFSWLNLDIYMIHGGQTTKMLGKIRCFQKRHSYPVACLLLTPVLTQFSPRLLGQAETLESLGAV